MTREARVATTTAQSDQSPSQTAADAARSGALDAPNTATAATGTRARGAHHGGPQRRARDEDGPRQQHVGQDQHQRRPRVGARRLEPSPGRVHHLQRESGADQQERSEVDRAQRARPQRSPARAREPSHERNHKRRGVESTIAAAGTRARPARAAAGRSRPGPSPRGRSCPRSGSRSCRRCPSAPAGRRGPPRCRSRWRSSCRELGARIPGPLAMASPGLVSRATLEFQA